MIRFVRGYLLPDGSEPGFGDSDDARLLPVVPRAPRDHAYLVGLGAALFGEPRPPAPAPPEEVVWWGGAEGWARWQSVRIDGAAPAASFAHGGVHVMRAPSWYVALRAGSYGQHGVGGHAHNDQLSIVVHAGGRPLLVDSGTGSYTADPVARDRFRGTAAHSTVIVSGQEQSPLYRDRPFALPDRARASAVAVDDLGAIVSLTAAHHGYLRLRQKVVHRRRVTLHRELGALVIEDQVEGRGEAPVEVCFQLAEAARLGASERLRRRVAALGGALGPLDVENAVEIGDEEAHAALVPAAGVGLRPELRRGWNAPRFGGILQQGLVSWVGLLSLPQTVTVTVLTLP